MKIENNIGRRGFLKFIGIGGASAAAVVAASPMAAALMSLKGKSQRMLPAPSDNSTSLSIPRDTPKDLHRVIMKLFETTRNKIKAEGKTSWFITLDYIQVTTPPDSKDFEVGIIFRYMPIVVTPREAKHVNLKKIRMTELTQGTASIAVHYPDDTWRGAIPTLMKQDSMDISLISEAFVSSIKNATFDTVYEGGYFDNLKITMTGNNLIS
jgi:hypothetical protein